MTTTVAYNDNDRQACAWLRELTEAGAITGGTVLQGSIHDLRPADLEGFTRVHLFAGIGGWELTLQLVKWPDTTPVWTGSCPCQPFSTAGKGLGTADHRHLWPEMLRLIRECRPPVVFGEQVASAAGRAWCAGVRADLEALGYAFGAADLCAAGVGAPHIRQRLYWCGLHRTSSGSRDPSTRQGEAGGVVDAPSFGPRGGGEDRCGVAAGVPGPGPADGGLGHVLLTGLEGLAGHGDNGHEPGRIGAHPTGPAPAAGLAGHWDHHELVLCRNPRGGDPLSRRIEPSTFPLVDRVPGRVGLLRGYGNAIVPPLAATFIQAVMGTMPHP